MAKDREDVWWQKMKAWVRKATHATALPLGHAEEQNGSSFRRLFCLGIYHHFTGGREKQAVHYSYCPPALRQELYDIFVSFHFHKNTFSFSMNRHECAAIGRSGSWDQIPASLTLNPTSQDRPPFILLSCFPSYLWLLVSPVTSKATSDVLLSPICPASFPLYSHSLI